MARTADLKESQDRLQAILDNAETIIYLKDIQGRYMTVNRRFETLFRVDRSEIYGLMDHDIFPEEIAAAFQSNDRKILETRASLQFEESAPGPDGELREYVSVKFPLKKADGSIYALCGISTDITDMKLADLERRRLRNYLFNIIDSMPSVLIGVDSQGRITLWNRRAEEVSGASAQEAMGLPLEQVYKGLETRMETVRKAIRTQAVQQHKKQTVPDHGSTVYEDITVFPLTGEGVAGAVIRVDDVTDQVRLEEMMIQSEKMLSVGGLAAGMAHEINNPLAGIMQTANVLTLRLEDIEMAANQKAAREIGVSLAHIRAFMEKRGIFKMLTAINESGIRVKEIVNNMLSFARKSNASVSSHNPGELMDRILDLAATDYDLKKQYDFKAIKIIKEYDPNLPMVPCEGAKIQQVILNILRNGAQAMVEGNTEAPCFTLRMSVEKGAGMLRIEIQDNGPGMDRAVRKRIFEPFFTTKPTGVGTGLGLSVSYFIITENHGGTMGVTSAPGKGSNFIIRLPLAAQRSRRARQGGQDGG
ncbi:MAG: PAS domain-containing protein [Desulfobacter sp.]|nr:MAG: PAS domain-containing protein [Desulfobacter sp.]